MTDTIRKMIEQAVETVKAQKFGEVHIKIDRGVVKDIELMTKIDREEIKRAQV